MLKKKWSVLLVVLAVVLVFPLVALAAGGPPEGRGSGSGSGQLVAGDDLTAEQEAALIEFWLDEHKALATYQAIMAQFGDVAPFVSIANAEQNHIAALEQVFARYDVAIPAVPTFDVPAFETLEDACAAAAQAEIDNAALYDEYLALFTQPDILRVANNLKSASLNNHLPAFEACANGEVEPGLGGMGNGTGAQRQGGMRGQGGMDRSGSRGRGNAQMSPGYGAYADTCPMGQE